MSETGKKLIESLYMCKDMVVIDLEADTNEEAIDKLAQKMLEAGVVKDNFAAAVKQRETEYCTGLQFDEMGIAVPHTMPEHVHKASVALATLKKPVPFCAMGTPEETVEAEMLFMLALQQPNDQLEFLKILMTAFLQEGTLRTLKESDTPDSLLQSFQSALEAAATAESDE